MKAAVSSSTRVVHAEGVKLVTGARNFMARSVHQHDRPLGHPRRGGGGPRRPTSWCWPSARTRSRSGEGRSQADIGLKGLQEELLKAVLEANKKIVVVLMSGRPLTLGWTGGATSPAILEAWLGGSQAGHAIADVLFGDYNPSGKLPVAFPRVVGQLPMTTRTRTPAGRGPSRA